MFIPIETVEREREREREREVNPKWIKTDKKKKKKNESPRISGCKSRAQRPSNSYYIISSL